MVTITKRGISCHKDLSGVMANARFGALKILGTDGIKYTVPSVCLKKNGVLKKNWRDICQKQYGIPA